MVIFISHPIWWQYPLWFAKCCDTAPLIIKSDFWPARRLGSSWNFKVLQRINLILKIVSEIIISSRIIENVTAKTTFCVQQFIYGKNLQSSYYKTKSEAIAFFFSSPPFLLLAPSLSPLLFLRYCDFGAYRAQETWLLRPFHSKGGKFRFVKIMWWGLKRILSSRSRDIQKSAKSKNLE